MHGSATENSFHYPNFLFSIGVFFYRLYERGNSVVGVEGVEKPVREFYQLYPDLNHSILDLPYGKLYKAR